MIVLVSGSIESSSADHSLGGTGILKDENTVNLVATFDSKYEIHMQIIVRNAQGQLVSVSESTSGKNIPHRISDQIFDSEFGEGEIIMYDQMAYEKKQRITENTVHEYDWRTSHEDMLSSWALRFVANFPEHGLKTLPSFSVNTPHVYLAEDDTFTLKWSIMRELT